MPEALSCVVDVDVVVLDVDVVHVAGAVGWTTAVPSLPMTNVVVALRVVLESSNDGAAADSRPTGAAEQAPSVTTATAAATRGVIFMGEDGWAGDDGRRDGRRERALRWMTLGVRPRSVNGDKGLAYRIGNRCTAQLTSTQEAATLPDRLPPAAQVMSDTLGRRIFLAHLELSYRLGRKVTLAEFGQMIARQMGRDSAFTAAAVSRWESGAQNPTPTIIEAIAAITHTDPGWISHGRKSAAPRPIRQDQPATVTVRSTPPTVRTQASTPASAPRRKSIPPRRKA